MKSLNLYITEKYKITKNTKGRDDIDVLLSALKESPLKFTKKFIDTIENWITENSFTKFKIYSKNIEYLEKELNFSDSELTDDNDELGTMYQRYFYDAFKTANFRNKYLVYRAEGCEININKDGLYFNKLCNNKQRDKYFEAVIVGEK